MYLGKPAGKSIEGPPYTIYLDAESARYGVQVRLKGTVAPNPSTGQLTTTVQGVGEPGAKLANPEAPFKS